MRVFAMLVVLGLSATAPAADPPPGATVTSVYGGEAVTQTGRYATVLQGVALATFGTGEIESQVGNDEWEAALQNNCIHVQFATPQVITLSVTSGDFRGDKSYMVSEFVVPTAVSTGNPMARVGEEFYTFAKWDPRILLLLKDVVGIRE